ncbi:MAG: hypothetical protein MK082_06195 [Phycisphaerales bacterium]|nr:hypothetical protein [Phycisphaerales bacterium]
MPLHALLVLDRERLRTEHAQFGRLVVALTANGCRVTVVRPDPPFGDDHPADRPIGLEQSVSYPEACAPWLRRTRLQELLEHFDRDAPDLVWAAGQKAWPIATGLAAGLERPIVVQVDGHQEARGVRRVARALPIAGLIAPTRPLADILERQHPKAELELVAPGIAITEREESLRRRDEDGPLAMTILGSSEGKGHYRALFEALSNLRDTGPGARFVLELRPGANQRIWRQVRRFDLADLTTVVSEPVRMQRLLAATDLVLRPVPEHRVRPIILEAMAMGTSVVSVQEPWLDYLGPNQGTTLLPRPSTSSWEEALTPLMLDSELRAANGTRAREAMVKGHRSSERAQAIESLFTRVVGEDPITMPEG